MPRLNFEQASSNLTWALSNLGLTDLFKPGFSQLHGISDYKWLAVSDIISKTYLDIKENPTSQFTSSVSGVNQVRPNSAINQPVVNSVPPKHPSPTASGHSGQQLSHISNLLNSHSQQHQQPNPTLFHHHPPQSINHLTHPFTLATNNRIKYPFNPNRHRNQQQIQPQNLPPNAPQGSTSTQNEVIDVNLNKPFVYFVIDTVSGLIMVMGKVGREPVSYRLPI